MTTATKAKEAVNGIDWEVVDGKNQSFADSFPRLQWMHGKRQFKSLGETNMNYTGGLFLPSDQFPNFAADGWTAASFVTSGANSKEITGFYSPKAYLSILRVKRWWDDGGSHTHALCFIKGVDALFSVQVGGVSKGVAFENAFNDHRKQIVSAANRSKPEGRLGLEPFALWFVLATSDHSMQKAKTKDAESEVTLPRLWTPKNIDIDYVRSLWVGTDNYKSFCAFYKETENWQTQLPKKADQAADNFSKQIKDSDLKQLLNLCGVKDYDEKDLALTVSKGETNKLENLDAKEVEEAFKILQTY